MTLIAIALLLWTSAPPAESNNVGRPAGDVEAFRKLSAEFDRERRAVPDRVRKAKTAEERAAAIGMTPELRRFARRFLELARVAKDDETVVDSLVWVVQYAGRTPEGDEAVRRLEAQFVGSDRIAGACWSLAHRREPGVRLLLRIVEENRDPATRGLACLSLAISQAMELREARRFRTIGADERPRWIASLGLARVEQLEQEDPAVLAADVERRLEQVVHEFPAAILNAEIAKSLPFLSQDLGAASETILQRAAESHPDPATRREAEYASLVQKVAIASFVANLGIDSADPPAPLVPGGAARLKAVDSRLLALEIDRRLRGIANRPEATVDSKINFYHLMTTLGSDPIYHAGAERLLRRVATDHADGRTRRVAQRSLAFHLAGMAEESSRLRFAAGSELAYWVGLLGEARVEEIRQKDPAALTREARTLAKEVVTASRADQAAPDRNTESLLERLEGVSVGTVAPEIAGEDLDGVRFRLSDYRGRVVLLDFWNHRTCGHCREAYPKLRELVKTFAGQPFALLGVDRDDERDELARLVADGEVTWRFWFKHGTEQEPTFLRWNIQGVPNVIVLDHRGVVRARFSGTPSQETLESTIKTLIAEVGQSRANASDDETP